MGMTRVWNVSNDPSTDVVPQNLMVRGKLLRPGQSMQVDEASLKNAHKTKKDIEAKLLAVGRATPSYLAAVGKAMLPAEMARGHNIGVALVMPEKKPSEPAKVEAKTEEPKKEESRWGKHKR